MSGRDRPELRIGLTPLCDAAPLVVGYELGFFAREGLRVELSREPSWSNIRDKLAAGAIDAAHALAPMPLAATLGVGPLQQPTIAALSLGLGGNAVCVSLALRRALDAADAAAAASPASSGRALARLVASRRAAGAPPLRFGTVFPVSMHTYELGYWLATAGLDPQTDVELRVVPPPRMAEELAQGAIDGFCVGEPWSSVAVARGIGAILLTGHDVWSHAPEKVLAVSLGWAERNPAVHRALLRALILAGRWCDDHGNRPELARRLSPWVDAPEEMLLPSLLGALRPSFHVFHRFAASFPWRSHAAWILARMLAHGQIEKAIDVRGVAAAVYRSDLYREAARELGLACPIADEKLEGAHALPWRLETDGAPLDMPPDRFLDGRSFDARDVVGHLAEGPRGGLRLPLDELAAAQIERG